jgi:internalin A
MKSKPLLIEKLEKQFPETTLTLLTDKPNCPAVQQWARPLSYAVNDDGDLVTLNLRGLGLTEFTITEELQYLQKLDLSKNAFTHLSFKIDLPALELLDISYNEAELGKIDFPFSFPQLAHLYLYASTLADISFSKALLQRIIGNTIDINLQKNSLDEALMQILENRDVEEQERALRNYFKETGVEVSNMKLIFLGNTGVGKTQLYDILNGTTLAGPSTHGINVFDYTPAGTKHIARGFDFGGQDYYHNTHLSFFSANALYILLWGKGQKDVFDLVPRDESNERIFPLNYWLGSVQYMVADKTAGRMTFDQLGNELALERPFDGYMSDQIQLCLLQNILDNGGQAEELNSRDLFTKYGFITDSRRFCLTKEGDAVRTWLDERVQQFVKTQTIPAIDVAVADALKELAANGKVVLSITDLAKIKELKAKQYKQAELEDLVTRLHWRLYLHAPLRDRLYEGEDGYQPLKRAELEIFGRKMVIDLKRFTGWIYTILEKEKVGDGYFTREEAEAKLSADKDAAEHIDFIIAFMLYYKIIFRVSRDETRFVAPNFLPEKLKTAESLFLDSFEAPMVQYEMKGFFHTNILTELLAAFFEHLPVDEEGTTWRYELWKNKVLLYDEPLQPDQLATPASKRLLYIAFDMGETGTSGKEPEKTAPRPPVISLRRFARNYVKDVFLKKVMVFIEQQIRRYEVVKWLLAPDGNYIPYDCLLQKNKIAREGPTDWVQHEGKFYRKGDFKLFLPEGEQEKYAMKKIFISYSKDDAEHLKRLEKHLRILERVGEVSFWNCRELIPGEKWDGKIKQELEEADIILFLVSANFLATDYIWDIELKRALQRDEDPNDTVTVVPIIVSDCVWEKSPLAKYNTSPPKAQIIDLSPNKEQAWADVVRGILKTYSDKA